MSEWICKKKEKRSKKINELIDRKQNKWKNQNKKIKE